jgi:hypothetical protein
MHLYFLREDQTSNLLHLVTIIMQMTSINYHLFLLGPKKIFLGVGWGGTESTWYVGHCLAYCTSPG